MKKSIFFAIVAIAMVAVVSTSCDNAKPAVKVPIPETNYKLVEKTIDGKSVYGVEADGKEIIPVEYANVDYVFGADAFSCMKADSSYSIINGLGTEQFVKYEKKEHLTYEANGFEGFSHWRFEADGKIVMFFPDKYGKGKKAEISSKADRIVLWPQEDVVVAQVKDSLSVIGFDNKVVIPNSKKIVFNKPADVIYASPNGDDWMKYKWDGTLVSKTIGAKDAKDIETAMGRESHMDNVWRVNVWKD